MPWLELALAAVLEIIATNLLPATRRFTRPAPTAVVCVMYLTMVALLARVVLKIDVAVAYTLWSALGILVIVGVGVVVRGERLNRLGYLGLVLVVTGIAVLNVGG